MKAYREWLPADGPESIWSIGGSFVSDRIEDDHSTPWDLGYGFYIKFDHDFIGRDVLERMSKEPHREKITFDWHPDDVCKIVR